ncbi:MAG: DNA gyrase C-terminal beta-propeller domain-containing protein, partial [Candidatus Sumerlaeia bacterium]|nr:DNA gyrase C-terminal beta-propeller domain-containing protein [Candidatus Sumerlaeia bacterium]
LSKRQADAILEMRLRTLTALEVEKLQEERLALLTTIAELERILGSETVQYEVIKNDLLEVKKKFGDARRSEMIAHEGEMTVEDLIAEERMVITITHAGYIRRTGTALYRKQKRGGKGVMAADTKDEDWVEHIFVGTTHEYLMFFTNKGQAYWLKVYELPEGGRATRGRPIVNLLEGLEKDEKVESVVPVKSFSSDNYLVFITRKGRIQRNNLDLYSNPRKAGIKAINILEGDELVSVDLTNGNQDLFIATRSGMAIRFNENDVRAAGRFTTGVAGIDLEEGDYVVGAGAVWPTSSLLTVCEKGIGKRSSMDDYRLIKRGGKGVINIKVTEKNGEVVSVISVVDEDELILITERGQTIRFKVSDFRVIGRNTQGVKMFDLPEGDRITGVSRVKPEDEDNETDAELGGEDVPGDDGEDSTPEVPETDA